MAYPRYAPVPGMLIPPPPAPPAVMYPMQMRAPIAVIPPPAMMPGAYPPPPAAVAAAAYFQHQQHQQHQQRQQLTNWQQTQMQYHAPYAQQPQPSLLPPPPPQRTTTAAAGLAPGGWKPPPPPPPPPQSPKLMAPPPPPPPPPATPPPPPPPPPPPSVPTTILPASARRPMTARFTSGGQLILGSGATTATASPVAGATASAPSSKSSRSSSSSSSAASSASSSAAAAAATIPVLSVEQQRQAVIASAVATASGANCPAVIDQTEAIETARKYEQLLFRSVASQPPWNSMMQSSADSKNDTAAAAAAPTTGAWWEPRTDALYTTDRMIGEGTYGSVYLAKCQRTGQRVALKKIRKEKKEGFPITAIREIKILKTLDHPHVVRLIDVVSSEETKADGHVYMVFEFAEHDLTGLLESGTPLSEAQIKFYMKGLLEGLAHVHSRQILHRDIKGANILISNTGGVKLADFGLARVDHGIGDYTNRVVTLWYRAPELLLGETAYTDKIDIWSAGCLFAEMLSSHKKEKTLFPGNNTDLDQLSKIYEICGSAHESNWKAHCTPMACDLLDKLLTLDPSQRLSALEALQHPYFRSELPAVMKYDEHPAIEGFFHEYNSKRRRERRARERERDGHREREREKRQKLSPDSTAAAAAAATATATAAAY